MVTGPTYRVADKRTQAGGNGPYGVADKHQHTAHPSLDVQGGDAGGVCSDTAFAACTCQLYAHVTTLPHGHSSNAERVRGGCGAGGCGSKCGAARRVRGGPCALPPPLSDLAMSPSLMEHSSLCFPPSPLLRNCLPSLGGCKAGARRVWCGVQVWLVWVG